MKQTIYLLNLRRAWCPLLLFLVLSWANCGHAQFNRIGAVMTVAETYTAAAAAQSGGAANLEVNMNNACAGANLVMQNSGTGLYIEIVAFYQVTEADPYSLHAVVGAFNTGSWPDADNFAFTTNGAGILQCVVDGTDDAGLTDECGNLGTVSSVYGEWYVVFAHELGRDCCLEQSDDVSSSSPSFICIMLQGYCGGGNIAYCSNPSVYYEGVQLLGTTTNDCGTGALANEGNNARAFALNGLNYQGSKPVSVSSLNFYNPLLTAVHCGGAAVATTNADQRTFAADQNFSGGTAWDGNGYAYAVDLSGVTSPAPPTLYQDQRYGNMSYTFNSYLPGTNYLVRLHFMEPYWTASGKRKFNVFINGQKVLTNFDIYATAGAQNRAVIKEISTTAGAGGQLMIGFTNVVDNACISGIEILQGGIYAPVNLSASAGVFQNILNWNFVAGATSYNVKRSTSLNGPFTTIINMSATNFTDTGLTGGVTYYYVVSALSDGNESFNSLEASATVLNPTLIWNKNGTSTTGAQDGSGTWADQSTGGAITNWWNGAANQFWSNSGQYVANFGATNGAAGTVTLSGGVTASSINFNSAGSGNYTIAGGGNSLTLNGPINANASATISAPVALGPSPNIATASGLTLTVSGAMSGSGGPTFTGGGTTILSANNTYSGGTTNSAGTLQFGNSGVGGSPGTGPVVNDGVLEFNRSDNFTWSTPVSDPGDAGTFLKINSDTMTVTSTNMFLSGGGTIQVNGGTVQINSPGLMLAGSPESDGEIWIAQNATTASCIVNGGTLIANSWLCVGRNSPSAVGTLTVNSGLVQELGGGNIVVGSLGATGTLTVNGGAVSNAAALWLGESSGGKGTLNLNGGLVQASQVEPSPNSAGGTAVVNFNGGTLQATANQANFISANSAVVQPGGAVIDDGGNTIGIEQPLTAGTGSGGLTKNGSGTLLLSAANTYTGPTTINSGTLRIGSPILHFSFDNVSSNTVINDGASGEAMNGTIVGGGASIVSGGRYGNALSLNGVGGTAATNIVLINSPVLDTSASGRWTVGYWIKTSTAGAVIMYQGDGGWSSLGQTTFLLNNNGASPAGTKAGGVRWGGGWLTGTAALPNNVWHFIAIVDNAGTESLYVDGNVDAVTSTMGLPLASDANQTWIGGSPDTDSGAVKMNGLIDEVYMFGRALSQTEVQSLYNNNTILNQQVLPSTTAVSLNTNATLDLGGLNQTIGSLSGSSGASVLLSATTNVNKLTVGNSSSTIFGGTLSGNGSITKNGTGTLTLSGLNTMAGNVNINGGTLTASSANQWNILATASALGNPSTVGRTVTINSGAGLNFGNGNVLGGPQSGKRPVLALAISGVANAYSGDMNTLGPITLNGGTLTTANGFNSSNQSFYLGGGLVTVSGSAASTISAGGSSNNGIHLLNGTTFNVADATGDANADLSVSAALMDQPSYDPGTGSLTKTGAGTMILSGANTYTGPTTVSAGTLLVSGTTSTGQVVIGSGGTLGGSGTIGGAVTNQFGGTLTPGGGLTTLKVNNNVTLQSGSMTVFEISKTAQTNDKLVVSGALSYGGTLVVTNLAGTFAGGENFQLFQAGSINGSFSSNSLPALSAGLAWNTNSLGNGTLSVIQTTPTNLMWSVSSTNLNLSWPAGYLGWHLQFQTNAPGIGLGTNWMNVLGSSFTNNVALPVDATQGSVFYRLTYP